MEASSELRVSSKVNQSKCIYLGKQILESKGKLALHAVGYSITNAVKAANRLVELGYAQLEKFNTQTLEENSTNQSRRAFKVVIELSKSPNFDRINEEFKKSRKET